MIDLHAHILWELDDGAQNPEESLHMAALAVRSGVSHMVATPHCREGGAGSVRETMTALRQLLKESGIPLKIYSGMEIFGSWETARLLREGKLLTLNHSRYPLIEFEFVSDGVPETEILRSVLRAGYRPVVAHPERYIYTQQDPELLNTWVRMGCLLQVNKGSLTGRFGSAPQALALELVDRGMATVVASDAHSPTVRTPWMYDAWELIAREISPIAAELLLLENPRRILNNESLPMLEPEWFS